MSEELPERAWVQAGAQSEIVHIGDPGLRRVCAAVQDFEAARLLCDTLVARLRELQGAGLAAPQIGASARVFVAEVRRTELFPDRPESGLVVMINPEILATSELMEEGWEGCFSIPGLVGRVPRHYGVTVRYFTPEGEERIEIIEGYLARVVQHEYDHLDGVLFLDRMTSLESLTTVENYKRFTTPPRS